MFLRKLNQCWGLCDGSISGHAWSPRVFSAVLCALFLISHTVCLVFFLSFFLDKSMFCGKHQLQWFTQVFPFLFFTTPSPFFSQSFVLRPLSAEFSFLKNEEGGGGENKALYWSQSPPCSLFRHQAVVISCFFRHLHRIVHSHNSGSLAFTFYSLVPLLQSWMFVQSSVLIRGADPMELVITLPCAWAPPRGTNGACSCLAMLFG